MACSPCLRMPLISYSERVLKLISNIIVIIIIIIINYSVKIIISFIYEARFII